MSWISIVTIFQTTSWINSNVHVLWKPKHNLTHPAHYLGHAHHPVRHLDYNQDKTCIQAQHQDTKIQEEKSTQREETDREKQHWLLKCLNYCFTSLLNPDSWLAVYVRRCVQSSLRGTFPFLFHERELSKFLGVTLSPTALVCSGDSVVLA